MKYVFLLATVLLGAGCGSPSTPITDTKPIQETAPEVAVQNFGSVSYTPTVMALAKLPNSKYEMDWQGWWKVGESAPGRPVYVLIEGSDEYFYATDAQRSVETRGHWKVSTDGALTVEAPERVFTTFKQGVMVDDATAYVLRGHTWEKWESVVDPMLP